MADRPITLLARREALRNAVFTVYLDHVRDASGQEVRDYLAVVPHHRAADAVTGVAVLPVSGDRVTLIRVYRHPLGEYGWEVARGFVDAGETPAAAALRELREETGLDAEASSLRALGTLAPEPAVLDARIRLFAASNCRPASGTAAGGEIGHRELRTFSPSELAALLDRGEIRDPCTLVCCYRHLGAPA